VTFPQALDAFVVRALEEDLASGDITTDSTVPENVMAIADAVAKSPLVLSGSDVYARCFYAVEPGCRVEQLVQDGERVEPGTVLLRVEGRARGLLKAERTALNLLQRLSGTASLTREYVDAAGDGARICDTRKTTPGLRALERKAVVHGGGHNHRDSLGSAVLIKDNHIAAAGGIEAAVTAARAHAPHTSRIEVEVTNLEETKLALGAGADILLLDNFTDEATREAVAVIAGKAFVELSGNMSLERMKTVAHLGADAISIGALTHSAPAADISLQLKRVEEGAPPVPGAG
jgi:nicotinate-nucleotide pyrophosphorylase (carboxylating)